MAREKKIELRMFKVHLICDCGNEMNHAPECYPTEFVYNCKFCGARETAKKEYPYVHTEETPECTHDKQGHCFHPAPWDPHDLRRVFTDKGWVCRRCGCVAVPEFEDEDIDV